MVWMKEEAKKKKITSVCLVRARVSYRAGAKVVLKNTIINCHPHIRCKARERGMEEGRRGGRKRRRYCICPADHSIAYNLHLITCFASPNHLLPPLPLPLVPYLNCKMQGSLEIAVQLFNSVNYCLT